MNPNHKMGSIPLITRSHHHPPPLANGAGQDSSFRAGGSLTGGGGGRYSSFRVRGPLACRRGGHWLQTLLVCEHSPARASYRGIVWMHPFEAHIF